MKETVAENFLNLRKDADLHIQEAKWTPKTINQRGSYTHHQTLQSQGQTIWKAANRETKNKSVQRICNEMHSMLLTRHYGSQKAGQWHFEIAGLGSGLRWPLGRSWTHLPPHIHHIYNYIRNNWLWERKLTTGRATPAHRVNKREKESKRLGRDETKSRHKPHPPHTVSAA